jgi:hypothetical protein
MEEQVGATPPRAMISLKEPLWLLTNPFGRQ